MKKIFVTFADKRMRRALDRIEVQAHNMGVYDHVIIANENNLDIRFKDRYKSYLKPGVKGFGYWIWKAQIVYQTLQQMEHGDLLQYTDAGCHLNLSGRDQLLKYFDLANNSKSGVLGFQAYIPKFHNPRILLPDQSIYKWCKGDLFDYFNVRHLTEITHAQSFGAGILFLRKCEASIQFIEKWLDVYKDGLNLIDDTPSLEPNIHGFIEHRHDQAIFSILANLYDIDTVSAYEYWYPSSKFSMFPDWSILKNYPIHAKRDKGIHWFLKPWAFFLRVTRRASFELKKRRANILMNRN
jgi:hypothetical protein